MHQSASSLPSLGTRHGLYVHLLKGSLALGAIYDAALAALLVLAPQQFADLLHVPLPETFYLLLLALLLSMLSLFYLLAAYDPVAYHGNVAVAIIGRTGGALILGAVAWQRIDLAGLWVPALAEALFAIVHGCAWLPSRRWR